MNRFDLLKSMPKHKYAVVLSEQNVDSSLNVGDFVYNSTDKWILSDENNTPTGVYIGSNKILISGSIKGIFTNLVDGEKYYLDSSGNITTTQTDIYIGFAVSSDEIIIDFAYTLKKNLYLYDRAVVFLGYYNSPANQYTTIDTFIHTIPGNATNFGSFMIGRIRGTGLSNGRRNRGLATGGHYIVGSSYYPIFHNDYVTVSHQNNAVQMGTVNKDRYGLSGVSNGTNDRAILVAGNEDADMQYFNISLADSVQYFGTLQPEFSSAGSASNGINDRAVIANGTDIDLTSIRYITISIPSDSSEFGTISHYFNNFVMNSNDINDRAIYAGSYDSNGMHNDIYYSSISILSNGTSFGYLVEGKGELTSTSNGIGDRMTVPGGYKAKLTWSSHIDYINVSSIGDATTFGYLTGIGSGHAGLSNGFK